MGSSGMKRKRRRRLPKVPGNVPTEGWELQHSPYTIEGEIEGARRFARGARYAPPRHGSGARVFVTAIFGLLVLALVALAIAGLIHVLSG